MRPQPEQARSPGLRDDEMIANIQFPNGDVRAVLEFYERLTGKQMIYDNTVQGQVNIVVNRPVSSEEAVRILETGLLINGFTLVPGPGNIVKVLGGTKNARQFAVPILSDLRDLPENDHIVSFLFRMEYAEPQEVQQALTTYVAQGSSYTAFVPLPKSQSLLVTESSNVIRMIARVIEALDTPPAEVISEFISLERADAKDIVEKLTTMFEKQPNQTGTTNVVPNPNFNPNWPPPPPPGGDPAQQQQGANTASNSVTLSEDSLIIGKIKITADVRTNRIHVVTRPINMPFIRRLVAEYDSNITFGDPSRRTLRFVAAGDVLDVAVRAILEPGMKVEENTGGTAGTSGRTGSSINNSGSINQGGNSGGVNLGTEELQTTEVDTVPESRTVGSTRIIADKRSNAIIVLGNQEAKDKIFRVLDQVDIRAPQVMLTAVIGELSLDDDQEFGVDYIQSLGRSRTVTTGSGGGATITTNPTTGFAGISRNTGIPITDLGTLATASALAGAPAGATAFIGVTKSLDIIVHALESTGRFRITSRPMVFTSNNKKAIITSGQQIAVPQNTTSGFSGSNSELVSTSSIQYKDVVLKLEVMPLINSDREVTLDIVQEVNSVSGSTVISGNVIPTISARKIKTTVSVANESTIVLGGLVQESKDNSRSGIPVLSRIPVVGSLFGNKKKATKRTELVVLLRPTVTNGPTEAVIAGEHAQERLDFPPDLEATLDPPGMRVNANPPVNQKRPAKPKLRSDR